VTACRLVGQPDAQRQRQDGSYPRACPTARRAITTTRWAQYSLSAWMSEFNPEGAIEIRSNASGEKLAARASSISLDRNTTGAAPVIATRTVVPLKRATKAPTSAKRDAWLLNLA